MATPQEQLVVILFSFIVLLIMYSAPNMVKALAVFGLLYSCYMWSCEYLHEMHIYLMAASNAHHLHQLSEACRETIGIITTARHYPWYEQYLHCSGELRGIEVWRTYRHYTAPHYLLMYIALLLFIYCIIKQGGRVLNRWFDNQPPAAEDTVSFENALALPGSYHTIFSLSYIAKLKNEFNDELCEARKRTPCPCEGLDIELIRTEKKFLVRDLETARGLETYYRDELHKLQLAVAKDGSGHRKQLNDLRRELSALKNPASSSKAALAKKAHASDQQKSAPSTIMPSLSDIARNAPRNRQLMTDNVRLTRDLTSTKEKLKSVENVFESTTCELRRANEDLTATKAMLEQRESKLEKSQGALKKSEAHRRSKAVGSKEAQDRAVSAEKKVQQTEEMLALKEIELQQKKNMLASRAVELQHAQKELASTKTAVDSECKDVERIKKELDRANTRAQEYQNKGLKLEGEFNIQKKVLEDTTRNLNKWGNESNKQRNEIVNQLRPEILHLRHQLAKGQSGHDEYVRKTRRIIDTLEEEKQLLQHTQNSAASQKEIARIQKILADEQPIRRDAQHQVHELQKIVERFGEERAFYKEQYGRHHIEVDKLKRDLAESASRLIRISSYDEVEQLKVEINQLKTTANRKDFECKADREKFDKAKESAIEQIKKLRKEVKELKDQLKEAEDAAKRAGEELEEVKILRGELAEKEKKLQLEKSKAEAVEVARKYLLSKGLAKTKEYQAFKENHAQQAQTGLGAGEDDVTKKHGRDGADSEVVVVVGARDPKRQQVLSASGHA